MQFPTAEVDALEAQLAAATSADRLSGLVALAGIYGNATRRAPLRRRARPV
ncbi:MAG: hypothetical protein M3N23_00780 [Pseudomonadota bacterium]|nr:hypothetical protein [Pseudomonadota bacterium]